MNDELRRAISIAQTVHDRNGGPADNTAVIIGALIRAVTILAGERPTLHEEAVKVYGPQPSGISGQLDEGLVEQLVDAYAKGCDSTRHGEDFCKNGIRAILAELATMPCELPNGVLLPAGDATGAAHVVLDIMRPILAAKSAVVNVAHARIAELESDRKNLLARIDAAEATSLLPLVQENERLMGALIAIAGPGPRDAAPERAIESAKHNSEIILSMISEAQRDLEAMTKIRVEREALAARVVELEKQLATLNDWAAICGGKAPTVDGKTPERVAYMAYKLRMHRLVGVGSAPRDDFDDLIDDEQSAWAECANAVLRAFGPAMAKQAAAEALGRVQRRLMPTARSEHCSINTRSIQEVFDNELAALESTKPAQQ